MNMLLNYFRLEAKRSFLALGKMLGSLLCTTIALTALIAVVCHVVLQTKAFPVMEVGVVLPEDENIMKVAATYVSTMDSVESICNFQYVTQSEAEEMMQNGQLQVVLVLPANLYQNLNYMENASATIILPSHEPMGVRVFGALLESGVYLLQVAEAGVSASYEVSEGYSLSMDRDALLNFLAVKYAYQALDRMDTFEEEILSPLGPLNEMQFYCLAFLLLALLLSGIHFAYLFSPGEKALKKKLYAAGVGEGKLALVKCGVMTLFLYVFASVFYFGMLFLSEYTRTYYLSFHPSALAGLLVLALAISVHFYLIYTLAGNSRQGILLLLLITLFFALCSGILVPAAYLPEYTVAFGRLLPSYHWNRLLARSLFDSVQSGGLLPVLSWLAVEAGVGVYLSWKNM